MPQQGSSKHQRQQFWMSWAIGGGIAGIVVSFVARAWDLPRSAGTEVSASGPGLSNVTLFLILTIGCAIATGFGAYLALVRSGRSVRVRVLFTAMWAAIALTTAVSNVYLAYHPGPDALYESARFETRGSVSVRTATHERSPFLVHLVLTLPLAGLLGGLGSGILLRSGKRRAVGMVIAWPVGYFVAAWLAPIVFYLAAGASVNAFEAAGLGAALGQITGAFMAGFVIGAIVGAVGSIVTVPSDYAMAATAAR